MTIRVNGKLIDKNSQEKPSTDKSSTQDDSQGNFL